MKSDFHNKNVDAKVNVGASCWSEIIVIIINGEIRDPKVYLNNIFTEKR